MENDWLHLATGISGQLDWKGASTLQHEARLGDNMGDFRTLKSE